MRSPPTSRVRLEEHLHGDLDHLDTPRPVLDADDMTLVAHHPPDDQAPIPGRLAPRARPRPGRSHSAATRRSRPPRPLRPPPCRGGRGLIGVDGHGHAGPERARRPSRSTSTTSLASSRSSPSPARARPSASTVVAQVNRRCPWRRLSGCQRRALVRLHVGPEPVAGKCCGHRGQVVLERRGLHHQGRRGEIPDPHRPAEPIGPRRLLDGPLQGSPGGPWWSRRPGCARPRPAGRRWPAAAHP